MVHIKNVNQYLKIKSDEYIYLQLLILLKRLMQPLFEKI